MAQTGRVSTGIPGFDTVIDMLRLGDNVVWQLQTMDEYRQVVAPFAKQAAVDGRRLVYMRFGGHPPLLAEGEAAAVYTLDADTGFESFATRVHEVIEAEGPGVFYVFDCLTDLLHNFHSDLMIGNFFKVTCPYLYQLDTVAYFALVRGAHTYDTVARVRETTQLLLDVYTSAGHTYFHPLKAQERYSPTMFFPHLVQGERAVSVTSSAEAAALFGQIDFSRPTLDHWEVIFETARAALDHAPVDQKPLRDALMRLVIGRDDKMLALGERYFTLRDMLDIFDREIGSGFVGGKTVGMLLARKILEADAPEAFQDRWEPHDSYYLGSDIFYTYVVQNGWWGLRMRQKTPEGYLALAGKLREKLLAGRFPDAIRERFTQLLEHYGQSPIIVRSSSLLEDGYGNAFAGKYESVFLANQGPPEQRYAAFEQAVRTVYASVMGEDALLYRRQRGLTDRDEQMAILVQRVSGNHYGKFFFPHVAGVGNSSNLYVWSEDMDPEAGMLRLVFGLGTRAVDRVPGDYIRLVPLDHPARTAPVNYGDERKFSQRRADVLDLEQDLLACVPVEKLQGLDLGVDKGLFFSRDTAAEAWLRELGRYGAAPLVTDFRALLTQTDFPALARAALHTLAAAYQNPVDVEFAANFTQDGKLWFNLLQCRPLQTRGIGPQVDMPSPAPGQILFQTHGNFMGGNLRLALSHVVLVRPAAYLALPEQQKYAVARAVGKLNEALRGHSALLIGPGRWGTTTLSLGIPTHFSELAHFAALAEVPFGDTGPLPELSFGSHFFQDLVETGIFYAAVLPGKGGATYRPETVLALENQLTTLLPAEADLATVLHVAETPGCALASDIRSQRAVCWVDDRR